MSKNLLFEHLTPVKNISGGSGAETWVVKDREHSVFVRKFANGDAGRKLRAQTQWLNEFKSLVYCPAALNDGQKGDYYFYDMTYLSPSETAFQTLMREDAFRTTSDISAALDKFHLIFEHLTPETVPANRKKYVSEKFFKNLEHAKENDPAFAALTSARSPVINGKSFVGLDSLFENRAVKSALDALSNEELYPTGHGDLTLSNLLVHEETIAFIDPNPNFEFISQEQEYSKVLQSTVVKYELFNNMNVFIERENTIRYSYGETPDFAPVNSTLLKCEAFKNLKMNSLYMHLVIHLARILPYVKPENKNKSYVYLAEIIKLLNEIAAENYSIS